MSTLLLKTKLYVPQPRPNLVPRPDLIAQLNAGLSGKLTVVSAPAGFGKTTLLSEWIHRMAKSEGVKDQPSPLSSVAWLSLDENDNDLARFLVYLIASLRTIPELEAASTGETLLQASQSPNVGKGESQTTTALLTELINEIAIHGPDIFVLVLDDYHLIASQKIHDALAFLVENLPPNMHLVVATRADLPIQVARLRGGGQLNELRLAELRFNASEAAAFLNQVMSLDLEASDIQALNKRTEGWIAGLQMASLALRANITTQGRENISQFIQAFTGSNRYVLDYLIEEVLHQQSEQVQTFLLQTSILNRLTAPLCDALTMDGSGDKAPTTLSSPDLLNTSQEILEYLDHANLFLIPLDDQREWYRYHRLFDDLLRQRLRQEHPELLSTLHTRASLWYEQNGYATQAIDHALKAKDYDRGAVLIEANIEVTLMRGEVHTALEWTEALPEDLVCSKPKLCLYHAWALMLTGRSILDIETQLEKIQAQDDSIIGGKAALQAFITMMQMRITATIEFSQQALQHLPEDETFMRGIANWSLNMAQLAGGDDETWHQMVEEILKTSLEIGNVMIAIWALNQVARLHIHQGQLHQAENTYRRALDLSSEPGSQRTPIAGIALIGLGRLHYEWNELETARRYLQEGIENSKRWREIAGLEGYVSLSRLKASQGDFEGANEEIQAAKQLAVRFDTAEWDDYYVELCQARLWVAQGNFNAATEWFEAQETSGQAGVDDSQGLDLDYRDHLRKYRYMPFAHALILQDQPAEALDLLESVLQEMKRQRRVDFMIEIQSLRALAYYTNDDIENALEALKNALSLAQPGGYVRVFIDKGEAMHRLIQQVEPDETTESYIKDLQAAFDKVSAHPKPGDQETLQRPQAARLSNELVEPLSEREIEVLRLLQTNLSTPEIADELIIAVSTVRTHIKNIYSKLGVHSRSEAVDQAKDLGLL
jgi:LuxR family maltose regulon positive regulatory protein